MGLDMYFTKKYYIWSQNREGVKITGVKGVNSRKVKEISEDAGYWRKANAIHGWFVENVQDGEDDCKEYLVDQEQMIELLNTVNKVLKASKLVKGKVYGGTRFEGGKSTIIWEDGKVIENPKVAKELLPVTGGFFFGNYDEDQNPYDQYYLEDLKNTKKILETALASTKEKNNEVAVDFYYSSSW